MNTVVYPYITDTKAWRELEHSIRSVKNHFTDLKNIVVIGDNPNIEGVDWLPHTRTPSNHLPKCLDSWNKMSEILASDLVSEVFVYMSDDIYLLKNMGIEQMRPLYCMANTNRIERHTNTKHQRLIWSTVDALHNAGISEVYNCETHMPRVFEKRKMRDVFERFNPKENRLLTATLYHNWFKEAREAKVIKYNPGIVAYFYGEDKLPYSYNTIWEDEIEQVFNSHLFLNHNDAGLSLALQRAIEARF